MRESIPEPFEFVSPLPGTKAPAFVFESVPAQEDLPPRTLSIIRLTLTVLLVSGIIAGLAWMLGSFVNGQLARLLTG